MMAERVDLYFYDQLNCDSGANELDYGTNWKIRTYNFWRIVCIIKQK